MTCNFTLKVWIYTWIMPGLFWTDLKLCIAQVSAIALDSLANFLLPVGHIGFEMIG